MACHLHIINHLIINLHIINHLIINHQRINLLIINHLLITMTKLFIICAISVKNVIKSLNAIINIPKKIMNTGMLKKVNTSRKIVNLERNVKRNLCANFSTKKKIKNIGKRKFRKNKKPRKRRIKWTLRTKKIQISFQKNTHSSDYISKTQ